MPNRKILLVEGRDDKFVLINICNRRGIPIPEIRPLDNVEKLLSHIPVRLKDFNEEGDVVGVIVDADTNLTARWQAIQHAFEEAGYHGLPAIPDQDGTVIEPPYGSILPRSGVWVMPDNRTSGILENFLHFLIPQQPNALFDQVIASVDAIQSPRFTQNDKPKAIIHTWLAWQSNPGRPYGTAIKARFLDPDVPLVDVLVSWLERLFNQPEST